MCGRYTLTKAPDPDKIYDPGDVEILRDARYNIAPSQYCPVIPMEDPTHVHYFRWGLIPHWAKDMRIGYKMINARAETLLEKASFRGPVQNSRCLVLADSFYEWKKLNGGKQPYRIMLTSEEVFSFAGLSARWRDPDGHTIESFTIITCEPNEVAALYHDRMPAILAREDARTWLDPQMDVLDAVGLLRPYPGELMKAYPVSPAVGSPKNDSDMLIKVFKAPE